MSNNDQPDIIYHDNKSTNQDNSVSDEPNTNSDNLNTKPNNEGTPHAENLSAMNVTDDKVAPLPDDLRNENDTGKMAMITIDRIETNESQVVGTITVNLDTSNNETERMVQITDCDSTKNTNAETFDDPLQGKTTPEKIAIKTLLKMGDSIESEDPLLDENAQLMPVDRPLEIRIEPKGTIPTEPVNPESLPMETTPPR